MSRAGLYGGHPYEARTGAEILDDAAQRFRDARAERDALDMAQSEVRRLAAEVERLRGPRPCGLQGAMPAPGTKRHDPKTGKERTFVRCAEAGTFAGAEVWAVEDATAASGSPVPWDTSTVWPWVVHVDVVVPCRDSGRPIKVTFTWPSAGPPATAAWRAAELAAIRRAGAHEAMESFGVDPHLQGDVIDCSDWQGRVGAAFSWQVRQ